MQNKNFGRESFFILCAGILALNLFGCGSLTSTQGINSGLETSTLAVQPTFDDMNSLANGRILIYGLDFENTITPLTDAYNPAKTLLYADFSRNFTNQNGGPFNGWQRIRMRRLGGNINGYAINQVNQKQVDPYPNWGLIPSGLNNSVEIVNGASGENYIYVPDPFAGENLDQGSFFVEFWMKPSQREPHAVRLLSKWDYPGFERQRVFQIAYYHHNISVKVSPDGRKNKNFDSIHKNYIVPEKWNHVAVAFSPSQLKIYINGNLNASYSSVDGYEGVYQNSNSPLIIGQGYQGTGLQNHFNGQISHIRIMNGEINTSDSNSLMRISYGVFNKVPGVGLTGLTAFLTKMTGTYTICSPDENSDDSGNDLNHGHGHGNENDHGNHHGNGHGYDHGNNHGNNHGNSQGNGIGAQCSGEPHPSYEHNPDIKDFDHTHNQNHHDNCHDPHEHDEDYEEGGLHFKKSKPKQTCWTVNYENIAPKFSAEDTAYNAYFNPEDDFVVYFPPDPTMGIQRDFMASIDANFEAGGSHSHAHYLLNKWNFTDDPNSFHFSITTLYFHPRGRLRSASGQVVDLWDTSVTIVPNRWYRFSLAVDGNLATFQTIDLETGIVSTVQKDITGFTPDNSTGILSIGKAYGRSGPSNAKLDNIKIYRGPRL